MRVQVCEQGGFALRQRLVPEISDHPLQLIERTYLSGTLCWLGLCRLADNGFGWPLLRWLVRHLNTAKLPVLAYLPDIGLEIDLLVRKRMLDSGWDIAGASAAASRPAASPISRCR
jgi:hypothetical protein